MQGISDILVGARLQFSAYGQAWSCEDFDLCPDTISLNPATVLMHVGIDSTGGSDPLDGTVRWLAYTNALDYWERACVEAVAESDWVTVFLWASPDKPNQNQNVYWGDARLVDLSMN